jgi:hypothetical protein
MKGRSLGPPFFISRADNRTCYADAMPATPNAPLTIRLETPHYILRNIEIADVTPRWGAWLADPKKAHMINSPARALDVESLRKYVADHDRISGHLLGIFAKPSGQMVGFWSVYVDWERSEFLVSVLIGERGAVSRNARAESQIVLLDHFYDTLGLETFRCSALARNAFMTRYLIDNGAVREHTSYRASTTEQAFVEVGHYRAPREAWHRLRAKLKGAPEAHPQAEAVMKP